MSDKNKLEPFPFLEIGGLYTIVEPERKLRNLNYCVWLCWENKHIVLPISTMIFYLGNHRFMAPCGQKGYLIFSGFRSEIGIKNQLVKIETTAVEDGA